MVEQSGLRTKTIRVKTTNDDFTNNYKTIAIGADAKNIDIINDNPEITNMQSFVEYVKSQLGISYWIED